MNLATVYVIDDSDTTRAFFENALKEQHEVFTAPSMREARDKIDFEQVDLLFLDCWLEDEEGLDLLEEIRQESDLPVIMISGYADHSLVQRAQELGVHGFIQKPLTPEKIRNEVDRVQNGLASEDQVDLSEVKFYGSPRVLIVDDDPATLRLLSRPLDHYGIDYETAKSPTEALQIANDFEPNIVVLDARLKSDMSSAELHQKLHRETDEEENGEEIFFVGITGYPESEEITSLWEKGLVEVFYKPFSLERLVRTIAHLSYVIESREQGEPAKVNPDGDEEPSNLRNKIKRYILIGLASLLIGLMLGFGLMGLQSMLREYSDQATTFERMFESIEGYLHRDEQREKRQLP